jgi:hypothetical protein
MEKFITAIKREIVRWGPFCLIVIIATALMKGDVKENVSFFELLIAMFFIIGFGAAAGIMKYEHDLKEAIYKELGKAGITKEYLKRLNIELNTDIETMARAFTQDYKKNKS